MKKIESLGLVLDLALARTFVVRETEGRLASHGLNLNDLALLMELHGAAGHKLRRVELAERLGVTPSGVARQLLPLERIGLVGREAVAKDARLALVLLTEAGVRTVDEVVGDADEQAREVLTRRWTDEEQTALRTLLSKAKR